MKLKANEANFRILGIETSCDETAAAVVKNGTDILSNIIASSENLHIKTGGIVPEVAAREQIKCILPVIDAALKQAFSQGSSNQTSTVHGGGPCKGPPPSPWNQIDAVAVTTHPGLIGSLVVGVETAKTLSYILKKPLVPVNHLVAHLYANWLNNKDPHSEGPELTNFSLLPRDNMLNSSFSEGSKCLPPFPSLGLIISGGHTELVLMKAHGNIKWLGGTRDDAAGEAFDKTAKMLNLGYPGGPAIERAANAGDPEAFDLPRPMLKEDNLEFSFSGLKTSLYYRLKKHPELLETPKTVSDLAASFQEAVVDVL
ncbi:hypothetical protein KKB83_02120, partial [Patescibacteria group bacterium]|nr:hypothetical protein [Patescibacteria group bacterium]